MQNEKLAGVVALYRVVSTKGHLGTDWESKSLCKRGKGGGGN